MARAAPYLRGVLYEMRIKSKLSENEVYCTAYYLLVILKNRVVNFITRKVLISFPFHIRLRIRDYDSDRARNAQDKQPSARHRRTCVGRLFSAPTHPCARSM